MAYLVVVTGPDGAGKSTLCNRLTQKLADELHEVSVWDDLPSEFSSKAAVHQHVGTLDNDARAAFVLGLLKRAFAKGEASGAPVLLLNGWWFKYAASELAYGASAEVVNAIVAELPRPDLVVHLDLTPQQAWQRKGGKASAYEQGLASPSSGVKREWSEERRFITFQKKIAKHWKQLERAQGAWQHVSSLDSPDDVEREVLSQVCASAGVFTRPSYVSVKQAHAVVMNPCSKGGRGLERFLACSRSEYGHDRGLDTAARFDTTSVAYEQLPNAVSAWLEAQMRAGARNIVAAGGDGTVNLVLNALVGARERLGLAADEVRFGAVGVGSSNDFQKPFRATGRQLVSGLHTRLEFENAHAHDIGRLTTEHEGETASRYFVVNSSIGFCAEAAHDFTHARGAYKLLKKTMTSVAINYAGARQIMKHSNVSLRLAIDGEWLDEAPIANLGVVKNPHFAGDMRYDVATPCDDGMFGVHATFGMSRTELVGAMLKMSRGEFSKVEKKASYRARVVQAVGRTPFAIEADGEVTQAQRVVLEAIRHGVFVCP